MSIVTTLSGKELSKIGIGSYGIGGRGHRYVELTEQENDEVYINAISYTLNRGSNFTEISLGYGHGNALRLFKLGLDASDVSREDVFITHSFYPRDFNDFGDIRTDTDEFYRVMDTNYADSILVTQTLILRFGEEPVFDWLHDLLDNKRSRYVSLSNASPMWIRKFKEEFGNSFFAHEAHLSLEVRANQDKGVLDVCDELGVQNIIWRPLRRSASLNNGYPLLEELTKKYNKSPSQVILNWMAHLGYKPMVLSTNPIHINENLSVTDFEMDAGDYQKMTDFRLSLVNVSDIDWEGAKIDNDLVSLVSDVEKYIEV